MNEKIKKIKELLHELECGIELQRKALDSKEQDCLNLKYQEHTIDIYKIALESQNVEINTLKNEKYELCLKINNMHDQIEIRDDNYKALEERHAKLIIENERIKSELLKNNIVLWNKLSRVNFNS